MSTLAILTVILFTIGAVQGIVYGVILLKSTLHNKIANRFLAVILFFLSYRLLVQTMRLFGLGYYDGWYYVMIDMSWVTGALLYFFVKALVTPKFQFQKSDFIHFLPFVIQICMSVFVRIQNLYWDGTRESLSWAGYWGYVVWMNYSTIYIVAAILIVGYAFYAKRLIRHTPTDISIDPERITWIKRILSAFGIYFSAVLITLVVDLLIFNVALNQEYYYFTRFYYYPFFGGLSILTYWIGMEGFRRKDDIGLAIKQKLPTHKKSHLEDIAIRLQHIMESDKLYTNPTLSLQEVAQTLDVKPYVLSNTLKEILTTKFSDYVNALRVQEVQRLLKDPENEKYTLLALAYSAGFNSKSSFNRSVKKQLGVSPSALRSSS